MEPDVEKKRIRIVFSLLQPLDGFISDDLARITFNLPHGFAIAYEIPWVFVARFGIVPCGKPVIKTVSVWRWFGMVGRGQAQVPFPDMSGGIPGVFEHFGKSDFTKQQVRFLTGIMNPAVDPGPNMMPSCQQSSP